MNDKLEEVRAGLAQVRRYWDERARATLPDLEKLQWSHRRTQRLRFEAFLLDHGLNGKSVVDVGCGLGDFLAHLQARGIEAEYLGYDIAPSMIQQCRARFPSHRFETGDFLSYQPNSRFDYTVAFGIHNIRVPAGRAILEHTTRHQFALSSIAAHVSVLSDRSTWFAPHLQAWPVEEILAMALSITPHVALHHDYLQGDFSVTLYREVIGKHRLEAMLDYDPGERLGEYPSQG
jgi:SAM-dependent methyltransferase